LNNNAIRFGLEWARIQPKPDTWDVEAIKHYRDFGRGEKRGAKNFRHALALDQSSVAHKRKKERLGKQKNSREVS
jgi:hypothetical protein